MLPPWWRLGLETARLALEAQTVVALRLAEIAAGGPGAETEARRMVGEKVAAAGEAALAVAAGRSARSVVRGYRRRVRANAKRLRRSPAKT